MNYLSLFNLKIIRETPEEEEDDLFEELSNEMKLAVQEVLVKRGFEVLGTEMMSHPISNNNYGRCTNCAAWTINRGAEEEREDVDEQIKDGGEHASKLLCCDCLPEDHEWYWKNI